MNDTETLPVFEDIVGEKNWVLENRDKWNEILIFGKTPKELRVRYPNENIGQLILSGREAREDAVLLHVKGGKLIQYVRKQVLLSTKELADKAGISESLVKEIEQGKVQPKYDLLKKLSGILAVDFRLLAFCWGYSTVEDHHVYYDLEGNEITVERDIVLELLQNPETNVRFPEIIEGK